MKYSKQQCQFCNCDLTLVTDSITRHVEVCAKCGNIKYAKIYGIDRNGYIINR